MNYYLHHIGDFNNATRHLNRLERSIYRDLIELYYDKETPIINDLKKIERLLLIRDNDEKEALLTILDEFFTLQDDGYHNTRCDSDLNTYRKKSDKARASAHSRWGHNANAYQTHTERNANQETLTTNKKKVKKEPFILPAGINKRAWGEFEQHRKEINKPLTDLARKKSVNILKDLSLEEQQTCINYSISGRYTGLFPQKNKNNQFKTAQQLRDEKNQAYLDRFDNNNIEGEIL